jgi:hypothetical protein
MTLIPIEFEHFRWESPGLLPASPKILEIADLS